MNKVIAIICFLGACAGQYPSNRYLPSLPGAVRSGYQAVSPFAPARSQYSSGRFRSPAISGIGTPYSSGRNSYGSSFLASGRSNFAITGGSYDRYQGGNQYGRQAGYSGNEINEPARYEFKYDVNAPEYAVEFGHEEQRDGDFTNGAYYVLLPDGRRQLVEYTADSEGYHPRISYTEPAFNSRFANNGNYQQGANYQGAGSYQGSYQPAVGTQQNYRSLSGGYQSRSGYQGNSDALSQNTYSGNSIQGEGY